LSAKNGELRSCVHIGRATAQPVPSKRNPERNSKRNPSENPYSLRDVIRQRQRNSQRNLTATESCAPVQKPADPAQLAVSRFVRTVNSFAVLHGRLLHRHTILAELDAKDRASLVDMPAHERQAWAELLANRLCRR